jgi:hypothetical protein
MNNFKSILVAITVLASVSMVSCKENKAETTTETTEKKGKEYTAAYVCPMHCKDSGSGKEGTCDTCGMTLVKNEDFKANQGKDYTSAYVCPMHCKDSGSDKEGTCDTCGMALVKNDDPKANGHNHD